MRMKWMPTTALLAATLLGGCVVYHQPVYQGNLLESKNVELLKTGMSKQDVLALLGTPSVADPFHSQRWDYVATEQDHRGQRRPEIKTLTLTFNGNVLANVEGTYFPEQDKDLAKKMGRFGNLPRDKKKKGEDSGGG